MGENTVDLTTATLDEEVAAFGPADGVLFDAFDGRLTDLDFYSTPEGTLVATTPDTSSVVRLAVTDRGLAATETVEADYEDEELTQLDQIDPEPEPDVDTSTDIRTRLRGD